MKKARIRLGKTLRRHLPLTRLVALGAVLLAVLVALAVLASRFAALGAHREALQIRDRFWLALFLQVLAAILPAPGLAVTPLDDAFLLGVLHKSGGATITIIIYTGKFANSQRNALFSLGLL
jgi:hypothetical protein